MVPVEAMASGRPVIAYARGGALETVVSGSTGDFFSEQSVGAIVTAVQDFRDEDVDSQGIASHARQFGPSQFLQKMRVAIEQLIE